jgi:hypothetical protein
MWAKAVIPLLPRQWKLAMNRLLPNLIDTAALESPKNRRKDGRQKFAGTSRICRLMSQKILILLRGGRYVIRPFPVLICYSLLSG